MIFKEAVSNIARHSECTEAAIALHAHSGSLVLTLNDDGKGFDTAQPSEGNGLESMRHRAERMGGRLEVDSPSGEGTTVTLKAPLK